MIKSWQTWPGPVYSAPQTHSHTHT